MPSGLGLTFIQLSDIVEKQQKISMKDKVREEATRQSSSSHWLCSYDIQKKSHLHPFQLVLAGKTALVCITLQNFHHVKMVREATSFFFLLNVSLPYTLLKEYKNSQGSLNRHKRRTERFWPQVITLKS